MFIRILFVLLYLTLSVPLWAQVVEIPDDNLRAAIREALALPADVRVTQDAMQDLTAIVASSRQIQELTGVEYAVNLRKLRLAGNRITDLRPIAGLTKLKLLDLFSNPISDLTPLANLAALELLGLGACHIDDIAPLTSLVTLSSLDLRFNVIDNIRPLAGLSRLTELLLTNNLITDVSPLSKLTSLERLELHGNRIADHTPLDGLSLDHFIYDQQCDFPPLPLQPRLENRTFPSVFTAWGSIGHSTVLNQPHLSDLEQLAQHDLHVGGPSLFHVHLVPTAKGWAVQGELDRGVQTRDDFIAINPNMVFLLQLALRTRSKGEFPDDSHYWIKDANGQPVSQKGGTYLWDFTHPDVQDIIVEEAIAVAKCGLYDGIFFDWWNDDHAILADFDGDWSHKFRGNEVEQDARVNIVRRIRAATRPDFLIMGNTNERILPRTGAYVNGGFMETGMPFDRTGDELEETVDRVEKALLWLENNLREPRINGLQAHIQPSETPDSPSSLRWMRAATALSLTHSDGYILFRAEQYHGHYWYNFWDANLGRPVGPKSQLYDEEIPGLYIRAFTNGWAVYNHSGTPQNITLPEEVISVASGLTNILHALPNLDGGIYLKKTEPVDTPHVNGSDIYISEPIDAVPGAALLLDASKNPGTTAHWVNFGTAGGRLLPTDKSPSLEEGEIDIPSIGFSGQRRYYTATVSGQTFGGPVDTNPKLYLGDWTLEFLCKRNGNLFDLEHHFAGFQNSPREELQGIRLWLPNDGKELGMSIHADGFKQRARALNIFLEENVWTWVTIVSLNGESIIAYQDGVEVSRHQGVHFDESLPLDDISIGAFSYDERHHNFNGSFSIVRVYAKALTPDEVLQNIGTTVIPIVNPADVNGDGVVNIFDLTLVAQGFGTDKHEADVNGDGVVNVFDLVFVANEFR